MNYATHSGPHRKSLGFLFCNELPLNFLFCVPLNTPQSFQSKQTFSTDTGLDCSYSCHIHPLFIYWPALKWSHLLSSNHLFPLTQRAGVMNTLLSFSPCVTTLCSLLAPHTYCMSFPLPSLHLIADQCCEPPPAGRGHPSMQPVHTVAVFGAALSLLLCLCLCWHCSIFHLARIEPKRLSQGLFFYTPNSGSLTLKPKVYFGFFV